MRHRIRPLAAAVVLATAALPAFSQVLDRTTLYRLERTSTFKKGCFEPCMCPMQETALLKGTFRLTLITVGNVHDFYEVTGVRFKVQRSNGEVIEITGSGTYAVSTIADNQRMDLTLVVGNDPPTAFHSGDVPGGAAFPRIALPVSINGMFCLDTVLDLRAKPARRLYVEPDDVRWDVDPTRANVTSDVVFGDLGTLRQHVGAFDAATWACAAAASGGGTAPFNGVPALGQGFWLLERETGDLYEDGDAAQVGTPDPGIAASPGACP